jgi:hypothetical protein
MTKTVLTKKAQDKGVNLDWDPGLKVPTDTRTPVATISIAPLIPNEGTWSSF